VGNTRDLPSNDRPRLLGLGQLAGDRRQVRGVRRSLDGVPHLDQGGPTNASRRRGWSAICRTRATSCPSRPG